MEKIDAKLEFWKNKLLDLGKRNRLINCPLPRDGMRVQRHSLLINSPNPDDVWSKMTDTEGTLSFPVHSFEDKQETHSEWSISTPDIETNQTPYETYKTLRSLMKKAKEFTEEKGLNILHLAFRFLNWKEKGAEGQEMRSPLLLVPVKLAQKDLFSPIILSRSDEEVSANYSLEQKLLNDFGIEMPTFTEAHDITVYCNSIAQAVKQPGWSISNDATQLSLFLFMKINMYRDLERNADKIRTHYIVRAINGESLRDDSSISDISSHDYDHDKAEPKDVASVLDTDSSQQDAVLLAKRGVSFVLQGPPGTGKSQTITNIIAELIAAGKKILFVSEKKAALEVVYKRLAQAKLAEFCLALHSHNAKRKEILNQFNESIELSRSKESLRSDIYSKLYELKEVRNVLNQYITELHTIIKPLGKTIYQVNGDLSRYENFRNVDYVARDAEKFTPDFLVQCERALSEIARIVSKSGYQHNNPWNGSVLTQPTTHTFRQRFDDEADILLSQIDKGVSIYTKINEMFGTNTSFGLSNVEDIQRILDRVIASPVVPPEWITLDLSTITAMLDNCKKALDEKNVAQQSLDKCTELCETVYTILENNEYISQGSLLVSEDIGAYNYNIALELCSKLSSQKEICLDKLKSTELAYSSCKESSAKEEAICGRLKSSWQSIQHVKLKEFCLDEKVLLLDIANILRRYRSEYRSLLSRIFGAYRKDRKAILAHCREGIKLTYEQGLTILDSLNYILLKKADYEKQFKIADEAEHRLRESEAELSKANQTLNNVANSLTDAELKLLNEKLNLLAAIKRTQSECQSVLDEKQQALLVMYGGLSDIITELLPAKAGRLFLRLKVACPG